MRGVSLLLIVGLTAGWGAGQFLNNRPYPTYSLESMPDTDFTCRDKILGGYYADSQTQCQMFHICVKVSGVGVQDFRFLCPNGTAFDQDHQICAEWDDVDCDATTLYYASDNFDLYRLGSGYESKAVKYGEDEETFSLQRAETGDARLNREHQAQRINQKKDFNTAATFRKPINNNNNNNNNNNDRDIFKTSSSSNFFNNRNGGKEVDDDEDEGNVNANQNRDSTQKRKLIRKQNRRPQEQEDYEQPQQQNYQRQQQNQQQRPQQNNRAQTPQPQDQNNSKQQQQQRPHQNQQAQQRPQQNQQQQQVRIQQQPRPQQPQQQNTDNQTARPSRPTGFVNNFAGSSYNPTTTRPTTNNNENSEQYSTTSNFRARNNGQRRPNQNRQYNDADNFRTTASNQPQTPSTSLSVSTPAPFRQTQQFSKVTQYDDGQYRPTTEPKLANGETENYPAPFNKKNFQTTPQKPAPFKAQQQPDTPFKPVESHPSTPVAQNIGFDNHYDVPKIKVTTKQAVSTKQVDNHPTTFTPKQKKQETQATTFAPKTNFAYTQTTQFNKQTTQFNNKIPLQTNGQNTQQFNKQTTQFNNQKPQQTSSQNIQQLNKQTTQYNSQNTQASSQNTQQPTSQVPQGHGRPFANQFSSQKQTTQYSEQQTNENSTPKSTTFTQYTPTVPKITSTTPVSRSNRFDETQYDDGSYNSKYENYDSNPSYKDDEFLKTAHSQNIASSRNEFVKNNNKKAITVVSTEKPFYSESPRPFSTNANTRITDYPKTTKQNTPRPVEKKPEVLNQQPKQQQQQQQQQQPQKHRQQQQPEQQPQQHRQQQQNQQHPQQQQHRQQQSQQQHHRQEHPQQQQQQQHKKKSEKNASYDYAYYDTNVGNDPEYDIDTDFKKTSQ